MSEGFTLRRVVVRRGDQAVLDGVDADIPGEGVTALWGASGAGKTTLLRLLNRLDVPDEGTVTYDGSDLADLDTRALRRRVGMVFQRATPFAGTVADNLSVAAPQADRDALGDALERVSLDRGLLERDADSLSGGELQRMCLARTLITEPEALLLDEPTSALDERPAREFERTVLDLAGRGLTAVWIGHDEAQVARVADRVLEVGDGAVRHGQGVDVVTISWAGLASSLVLVAVAAGVSLLWRLGLERSVVWAAARALVQLLLVGGVLVLLLAPGVSVWWSWLWVAAMIAYAGWTARRRAPTIPGLLPIALAAFVAAAAVTLLVLFGLGVFPLSTRTLVPMAGLIIGNAMTSTVLAGRRLQEEFADKRAEIEARLALGQSSRDAARPYLQASLRSALTPQIETTKATGLVFLPGAMTGLIIAGVEPIQAVLVQAVVMFLVLAASATTTSVVALGLVRRLFTADHRLLALARER